MSNKVYYRIGMVRGKLQYHVSADKKEAQAMRSMSRSIELKHGPEAVQEAYDRWMAEIDVLRCVPV
jgi:hypothetical protein